MAARHVSEVQGRAADDDDGDEEACISAVRSHIPSLRSWQGAAALLLSLPCGVYLTAASILLRFFIPGTLSPVLSRSRRPDFCFLTSKKLRFRESVRLSFGIYPVTNASP